MLDIYKILFPVDFSERCREAAPHVKWMADAFGASVMLIHVVEMPLGVYGPPEMGVLPDRELLKQLRPRAQEQLDSFRDMHLWDVPVDTQVCDGDPAQVITRVAKEQDANLIMMPTHGYGPFRRFMLGSVTAKVLHDAECPVWTSAHLDQTPAPEWRGFRRVICAVDLEDRHVETIRQAAHVAGKCGAGLHVVHIVAATDARPDKYFDAEFAATLTKMARERVQQMEAEAGVTAPICVKAGPVAKGIHDAAVQHQADLLVVGRGGHGMLGRLRTHGYAICRESPCPVLSV